VGKKRFAVRRPIVALSWNIDPDPKMETTLAIGVEDQVYVWSPDKNLFDKRPAGNRVTSLSIDAKGRVLIGVGSNNPSGVVYSVMLWDRSGGTASMPVRIGAQNSIVTSVAWSENGSKAASSDATGRIYLWDTQGEAAQTGGEIPIATLGGRPETLGKVRWRKDGRALAWTTTDAGESLHFAGAFDFDNATVLDSDTLAAFTDVSDPQSLFASTPDGVFASRVRDAIDGASVKSGIAPRSTPPRLYANSGPDTFSQDGQAKDDVQVATVGTMGGTIVDSNNVSVRALPRLAYYDGSYRTIALPAGEEVLCGAVAQPDTRKHSYLVVLGTNRGMSVWEASEDWSKPITKVRDLEGFEQRAFDVAVSPARPVTSKKGTPPPCYAAFTLADGTVRVWNLSEAAHLPYAPDSAPGATSPSRYVQAGDATGVASSSSLRAIDNSPLAPLVSLFPSSEGDWVAWNDLTGYYASSAGGDKLVGWHINQGELATQSAGVRSRSAQKASRFAPAEFRHAYEMQAQKLNPDILAQAMRTGNIEQAALFVSPGQQPVSTAPAEVALSETPRVVRGTIQGADGSAVVEQDGKLIATSPNLVVEVEVVSPTGGVLTQKCKFNIAAQRTPQGAKTLKATEGKKLDVAGLQPGENRVVIAATMDETGAQSQPLVLPVIYRPTTPVKGAAKRNVYVVAVGVGDFPHLEAKSKLQFSEADANALAKVFKEQESSPRNLTGLFHSVQADVVTGERATNAGIIAALDKAVQASQSETFRDDADDLVVVYLSTHGLEPSDTGEANGYYFATLDTKLSNDRTQQVPGLALKTLVEKLKQVRSSNVLLLMDNCFAGAIGQALKTGGAGRVQALAQYGSNQRGRENAKRLLSASSTQFVTLAASTAGQESWEGTEWGHGAFTYTLLRALRGELPGVVNEDGYVTLRRMTPYLQDEVQSIVKRVKEREQTPQIFPSDLNAMPSLNLARLAIKTKPGKTASNLNVSLPGPSPVNTGSVTSLLLSPSTVPAAPAQGGDKR
jgi:uncharacterized caspase-like protein/WD40 repeat protein